MILEAGRAVHAGLPSGLGAVAYREALGLELTRLRVPLSAGVEVPIHYKGIRLATHYRVDFVCLGVLLVLVRATEGQGGEVSWLPGCLEASGAIRALVLEFGGPTLQWAQVVRAARPRLVAEGFP
jgi:GxxExxY protein